MASITLKVLLFLGSLVALMTPVQAECDPSHAVVAIASILSTLAVVALVLIGVFFFLRRKRQAQMKIPEFGESPRRGRMNNAYLDDENFSISEEGVLSPGGKYSLNTKEQILINSKNGTDKTWSSLPRTDRTGRLYRKGSCGSLDENMTHMDPETVSVTLESQDIIGLGFNICGSYGDGIRVSEVNNRGPAKESGEIKVGDRILSVTVSYENIVYEDALTILSYASPYPVKIVLQKATNRVLKNFDSQKYKGGNKRRLSHPLYRSSSMDEPKSASNKNSSAGSSPAKRAHSEVKAEILNEGGNRFLKWRNKNSKKDGTDKDSRPSKKTKKEATTHNLSDWGSLHEEIDVHTTYQAPETVRYSKTEDPEVEGKVIEYTNPRFSESDFQEEILLTQDQVDSLFTQKAIPDKPERKNRRKSDVQSSPTTEDNLPFESNIISSGSNLLSSAIPGKDEKFEDIIVASVVSNSFSMPASSEYEDCTEAPEEEIVAQIKERIDGGKKSNNNSKDINGALSILREMAFSDSIPPRRTPSPDVEPVEEEEIVASSRSDKTLLSASPPIIFYEPNDNDEIPSSNKEMPKEKPKPPLFEDEVLERIIAMNSFAPGTQGWAGVSAGGSHGGVMDDFIPNQPGFMAQPVPRSTVEKMSPNRSSTVSPVSSESDSQVALGVSPNSSHNNNNIRGMAYEIRDDVATGKSFAVEINKHKPVTRTGSEALVGGINAKSPVSMRNCSSFDMSRIDGSLDNVESEELDNLEWSGQRLVRSESFSNIFVND